jgi:exopolysaccharide biosynthesis polyprenyl glycosylphosphotransferase
MAAAALVFLLSGWRLFLHGLFQREPVAGALRQKVLFVGWNNECGRAIERLRLDRARKLEVVGVVAPQNGRFTEPPASGVGVLGRYETLRRVLRNSSADILMVVDGASDREGMLELAEICGKEFVDFKLVPSCFQVLVSGLQFESIHGLPVLGVGRLPLHHAFNNMAKRALDILGALFGLLVSAPVMAVFAALVYLESPGPVVYRQRRVGLNGRPFHIFKIRSMKPDAEKGGGPGWTVQDDPRRLRIGALMRAWNIDELPQFWNVLKGEMSLVGPRPERPELIEDFKEEIPHYNVRHNIKPGITGWAQVNGLRGDTCLRERVKFDLDYIEHWNFIFDLRIMLMTLVSRKGAC